MQPELFYYIGIIFLGFIGFTVSSYIHMKKKSGAKQMVCPLKAKCKDVITSEYSYFFGIPVSLWGMTYYGFIALWYATLLLVPIFEKPGIMLITLGITTGAFLFSVYLTAVQAFTLKDWCSWCVISAIISTLIFGLSLLNPTSAPVELIGQFNELFAAVQLWSVSVGIGAATVAYILFHRFLKDFRISQWEAEVLMSFSQTMWAMLGIILLSGAALYIPQVQVLNESTFFHFEMYTVFMIIIVSIYLQLTISPKLIRISFRKQHNHQPGELHTLRKQAFSFGAIWLLSWYTLFAVKVLPDVNLSLPTMIAGYLGIMLIGGIAGLVLEKYYNDLANKKDHHIQL